jgi:diadenosine tetraphosphate (Ap4A) HIT family hydrolase
MTAVDFVLDRRLAADTVPVSSLTLCDVLLMNDARYPWLILVPRLVGLVEITDLDANGQTALWRDVSIASVALLAVAPRHKLNLGALGNIVRQLHVHLVARHEGDYAWPGPVWGHGMAVKYEPAVLIPLLQQLRGELSR